MKLVNLRSESSSLPWLFDQANAKSKNCNYFVFLLSSNLIGFKNLQGLTPIPKACTRCSFF